MAIQFFFQNVTIRLTKRKELKIFLQQLFSKNKRNLYSLNVIFCTDEFLLSVNKKFLGHDNFTDVITFNLSEKPQDIHGEIYISAERVRENALSNRVPSSAELHRVIFHGVLHLCGYNDKIPSEKAKMTKAENDCLSNYSQQ